MRQRIPFLIALICLAMVVVETQGEPKANPAPTPMAMAIDLFHPGQLDEYRPNYCNKSELAAEAGLLHSPLGQFLGFPCSNEFFHCRWQSDGYRTYRKNCRPGLVYDTLGTQNCNYDHNVKGCGMQGGASDKASCKDDDFTCPLSERCLAIGQRCDGKYDCALEEDEQNCPMCRATEFPCVISEECIPMSQRCNGVAECQDKTDERDCEDCGAGKWYCRKSGKCIESQRRCNSVSDCPHGEDELLCKKSPLQLPLPFGGGGGRLCGNSTQQRSVVPPMPISTVKAAVASFPRVEFTGAANATTTTTTPKSKVRQLINPSTASPPPPLPPAQHAPPSPIPGDFEVEMEVESDQESTTPSIDYHQAEAAINEEIIQQGIDQPVTSTPAAAQSIEVNEVAEDNTSPPSSNLLARGAAIPLSKYPLVNPWKASVASGAFMRKGGEEVITKSQTEVETTTKADIINVGKLHAVPPKSAEERQILRRLSDKYGTSTRDLLRKIEQLLQADENLHRTANNASMPCSSSVPQTTTIIDSSHGVTQPPLERRPEEEKRIRVTRRPTALRKWRPVASDSTGKKRTPPKQQ